jgi:hypothetical protein
VQIKVTAVALPSALANEHGQRREQVAKGCWQQDGIVTHRRPGLPIGASTSLRTQLVEPLERLRAHVEVAFTFPQCAQQSRTSELIRAVERVFRPRVVASSIVLSSSMANGWAALYQLLARVQLLARD